MTSQPDSTGKTRAQSGAGLEPAQDTREAVAETPDLTRPDTEAARANGSLLLPIARAAIGKEFGLVRPTDETASWLQEPGATFVTLTKSGRLRGCIGSLEPWRQLVVDIKANAVSAAFRDPRFGPLLRHEFAEIRIEVSLISAAEPVAFTSEAEALAALRPGVDGVIFEWGRRRSTFLPLVWEQLPDVEEFMGHLKRKAGLPVNFWADDVALSRYTVSSWHESGRQEPS